MPLGRLRGASGRPPGVSGRPPGGVFGTLGGILGALAPKTRLEEALKNSQGRALSQDDPKRPQMAAKGLPKEAPEAPKRPQEAITTPSK